MSEPNRQPAAAREIVLAHEVDWGGWRNAARRLALGSVPPESVVWSVGAPSDLFTAVDAGPAAPSPPAAPAGTFAVPRALVDLAQTVIQAREPEKFALLYRLVWRAHGGEKHLLEQTTDPEVDRANRLAQSVRRDTHKMRAFVRFREVTEDGATRYVAWFEPAHFIVEANAAFFVRRFATMTWSILTPYRSAHWNGSDLAFAAGASRADVPDDDRLADYWRVYFSSIFNPARLKIGAMTSEMPRKYWRNLPEAAAIPDLVRSAQGRVAEMVEQPVISPPRPTGRAFPRSDPPPAHAAETDLGKLAAEAAACRRCALWEPATQIVFGEGPADAAIMLVGEQPGDQEDLAGRPFVGPAGQLLDRALAEAGIDRRTVYVTNAVKHFKFEPRGKRRIHATPDAGEIAACRFWLEQERLAVRPHLIVLMGASAARAVLGRAVTISRERGRPIALAGPAEGGNTTGFVTVHPSYLLRLPDEAAKQREYIAFVNDLRQAKAAAGDGS
jgi:DNA polymerase